jgi:hypothetical protein
LTPVALANSNPERCDAAPTPDEPKVSPSGFSFASRIKSAVELTGSVGLTTSR